MKKKCRIFKGFAPISIQFTEIAEWLTSSSTLRFLLSRSSKYNAGNATWSSSALSSRAFSCSYSGRRWKARVERVKALDEESFMRNIKSRLRLRLSFSFLLHLLRHRHHHRHLRLRLLPPPCRSSPARLRIFASSCSVARRESTTSRFDIEIHTATCLIFDTKTARIVASACKPLAALPGQCRWYRWAFNFRR